MLHYLAPFLLGHAFCTAAAEADPLQPPPVGQHRLPFIPASIGSFYAMCAVCNAVLTIHTVYAAKGSA